jgi:hypothetical protein
MLQEQVSNVLREGSIPRSSLDFLDGARSIQTRRAEDYDQPDGERSMEKVVQMFNLVTGHELKESDGWLLQQLLKIVRDQSRTEAHVDSLMDNIGYGSLYAEARMAGK